MKLRGLAAGALALATLLLHVVTPVIAQSTPGRSPAVSLPGASTVFVLTQNGQTLARSNSGAAMLDNLPGGTVLPEGWRATVKDDDATALMSVSVANGSVTGSISGTTFTAASGLNGTFKAGQYLGAANGTIAAGTKILSQLTGPTGGLGTYQVSISQTVGSTAITFGATLNGSVLGYVPLGPTQSATFVSDGVMAYRSVDAPPRAVVPPGVPVTLYMTTAAAGSTVGPCLTQATACTPQVASDTKDQRFDVGASQVIIQAYAASLPATLPGFLMRGKPPGLGNSGSSNPYYHSVLVLGDAVTPSNYVISNGSGSCAQAIQGSFHIKGFTISGCVDGIVAQSESTVGMESIAFGANTGSDVIADDASIHWDSNLTKTGAADCHLKAINGGIIRANSTSLSEAMSSAVWTTGNYCTQSGGQIANSGTTQTGTATGPKFAVGPYGGGFAIGSAGTDANTLLKGSSNGVYVNYPGPANGVVPPGSFSTMALSGGTSNHALALDNSSPHNVITVDTAAAAVANGDTFPTNQGAGMLVQSFTAVQTWIRSWIAKSDVGLGNVANVDTTNAANISSGTLPAGRMPALTGDCTTSVGAVATTCLGINGVNQNAAWTTYTPTVTSQTGTITTSSATGRYRQIGKTIILEVDVTITTAGTGAGGLRASLPLTAAAFNYVGISKATAISGKSGAAQIAASGTIVDGRDSTGTTFIASGEEVVFGITYEIP